MCTHPSWRPSLTSSHPAQTGVLPPAHCTALARLHLYVPASRHELMPNHALSSLFLPLLEDVANALLRVVFHAAAMERRRRAILGAELQAVLVPGDVEGLDRVFRVRATLDKTRVVLNA